MRKAHRHHHTDGMAILGDGVAVTPQFLLDQSGQTPIIVDVEQADGLGRVDRQISGAWITDRNRPN